MKILTESRSTSWVRLVLFFLIFAASACANNSESDTESRGVAQNDTVDSDTYSDDASDAVTPGDDTSDDTSDDATTGEDARDDAPPAVTLAENGEAQMKVLVFETEEEGVRDQANQLAQALREITDAIFEVESIPEGASTARGIVVGTAYRFDELADLFDPNDPTKTEDYLIRTHENGLILVGATELAVKHAVADFLYRIGKRHFFSSDKWKITPHKRDLDVAIDTFESPDYLMRSVWPSSGRLNGFAPDWTAWNGFNRMAKGISLRTGHAYGAIIRRNQEAFENHPEYLTQAGGDKFCISNEGLQDLVVNDALSQISARPSRQSVSLEPSDGGGWESDSCPDDEVYQNITDRVVTLANRVAEGLSEHYEGKYVSIYAYNEHSPPPTIDVHDHVVLSVATEFIRGGYTVDSLLQGWSQKATHLGIREYYSIFEWNHGEPSGNGADIAYLRRSIPYFHENRVRFLTGEAGDNWGSHGLGYYIASRLLWDTAEADQVDELVTDFLEKSFGDARGPMRQFYQLLNGIDGKHVPVFTEDYVGRLYRHLKDARASTDDEKVRARLQDLVLYVRYLEMLRQVRSADAGDAKQDIFNDLLRFTWQIRDLGMIHTVSFWKYGVGAFAGVEMPDGSGPRVSPDDDPLKRDKTFSEDDIEHIIEEGVANNSLRGFEIKNYSRDLVPTADFLNTDVRDAGDATFKTRGTATFYTWVWNAPATLELKIQGGLISHFQDRGNVRVTLSSITDGHATEEDFDNSVPPDAQERTITLQTAHRGLHKVELSDGSDMTKMVWPAGLPVVQESGAMSNNRNAGGRWGGYFYIPEGTQILGGYTQGRSSSRILDSDGATVLDLEGVDGYFRVEVPAGQGGKVWRVQAASGPFLLLTVPQFIAPNKASLLLPAEVVP